MSNNLPRIVFDAAANTYAPMSSQVFHAIESRMADPRVPVQEKQGLDFVGGLILFYIFKSIVDGLSE